MLHELYTWKIFFGAWLKLWSFNTFELMLLLVNSEDFLKSGVTIFAWLSHLEVSIFPLSSLLTITSDMLNSWLFVLGFISPQPPLLNPTYKEPFLHFSESTVEESYGLSLDGAVGRDRNYYVYWCC